MPYTPLSLASRSNQARDTAAGCARLINCYTELLGNDAKNPTALYACDGFSDFSTLTSGGVVRGLFNLDDSLLWAVSGDNLYSVTTDGTATNRESTIGIGAGEVAYFARNPKSTADVVMTTSDGITRTISGTTVSTPSYAAGISAGDFNSVVGHDDYFIWTKPNGEYYVSGVQATTIDELDFDVGPAGLMRGVVRGRDVCLFGNGQTRFIQNTGDTDFPYERIHDKNFGLYAAPCAVGMIAVVEGVTTDTVVWPATDPTGGFIGLMMLAGYDAIKISTWEIDDKIRNATKANLRAYAYSSQGHSFYCITDATTFSYEINMTTRLPHERQGSGIAFSQNVAATEYAGQTVLGDYTAGSLYKLDTSATPAAAATVSVEVSRDNGSTWTTARTKTVGTSRNRRTKFNRFGQSEEDGFQFRIKITSAYVEDGNDIDVTIIPAPVHATPFPVHVHTLYVGAVPGVGENANQKGLITVGADIERVVAA